MLLTAYTTTNGVLPTSSPSMQFDQGPDTIPGAICLLRTFRADSEKKSPNIIIAEHAREDWSVDLGCPWTTTDKP